MSFAPTVFEEFNARGVDHAVLASKFVAPAAFGELAKPTHTVLVGPRGSGKTTLLRMLETPSLESWVGDVAKEYRATIDYSSVFIPTDRNWDRQLSTLGKDVLDTVQRAAIQDAVFCAHVLWSLVDAMEFRIRERSEAVVPVRPVRLTRVQQATLAEGLADVWSLELRLPSLASLKMSLRRRMLELQQLAGRERLLDAGGRGERIAAAPGVALNYQDAAALAVELFNELVDEPHGRWALMFDELEFAPERIREQLIGSLRSTDPRFLFKLSLAPYTTGTPLLGDLMGAMSGHDFVTIPLFFGKKEDGYDFARQLADSLLDRHGVGMSANEYLGRRSLGAEAHDRQPLPRSSKSLSRTLQSLVEKDPSFAKFLADRRLTPDKLVLSTADARASDLRKILPLVAIRNQFLRGSEARGKRRVRGLQSPDVYSGDVALFAMLESNPRNLTGVLSQLIAHDPSGARPTGQMTEIRKVRNRFRALLSTVPTVDIPGRRTSARGLLGVIDAVGEFFRGEVLSSKFSPDPPGTFVLDSGIEDDLLESLGVALNAGAIVYVQQEGQEAVPSRLRGNKYRLSYLFAPSYRLPIRLGRERNLSGILSKSPEASDGQERFPLEDA